MGSNSLKGWRNKFNWLLIVLTNFGWRYKWRTILRPLGRVSPLSPPRVRATPQFICHDTWHMTQFICHDTEPEPEDTNQVQDIQTAGTVEQICTFHDSFILDCVRKWDSFWQQETSKYLPLLLTNFGVIWPYLASRGLGIFIKYFLPCWLPSTWTGEKRPAYNRSVIKSHKEISSD